LGWWVIQLHGDRVETVFGSFCALLTIPSVIYKYYISQGNGLLTTQDIIVKCDWFCIILFCFCKYMTYTSHLCNFHALLNADDRLWGFRLLQYTSVLRNVVPWALVRVHSDEQFLNTDVFNPYVHVLLIWHFHWILNYCCCLFLCLTFVGKFGC
jgi:hypothetical protein